MTRELPILFSAPMVRAILDGRKTMTRRLTVAPVPDRPADTVHAAWLESDLKPEPYLDAYCGEPRTPENPRGIGQHWCWWTRDDRCGPLFEATKWRPGDTLWVKEKFTVTNHGNPVYAADFRDKHGDYWQSIAIDPKNVKWLHPVRMFPEVSRITLRVTGVRVERLQDITEADAIAEGATAPAWGARDAFRDLWDSLYAKRGHGWDANPWVSVTTFERTK